MRPSPFSTPVRDATRGGVAVCGGATSFLYTELKKPGRYAAVCFLPVGSTDQQALETADGPPHASEGMVAEFEVE
jgi:hypothetical protein